MPLGVLGCWTRAKAGGRRWVAQLARGCVSEQRVETCLAGIREREEGRTGSRSCWNEGRKEGMAEGEKGEILAVYREARGEDDDLRLELG